MVTLEIRTPNPKPTRDYLNTGGQQSWNSNAGQSILDHYYAEIEAVKAKRDEQYAIEPRGALWVYDVLMEKMLKQLDKESLDIVPSEILQELVEEVQSRKTANQEEMNDLVARARANMKPPVAISSQIQDHSQHKNNPPPRHDPKPGRKWTPSKSTSAPKLEDTPDATTTGRLGKLLANAGSNHEY